MASNALSVDLEEYFQVSNFADIIDRSRWGEIPSRLPAVTERILTLFDAHQVRATFFVLGWVAERHPALVRRIAERGHEIASHGYSHDLVYDLGPEGFRADLRKARRALTEASGTDVVGYRAPSFSITARSTWALRILAEEGFSYDSSVFPIRHPRYGMPGFPSHPLTLDLGDGVSIREFPLTTIRFGPMTFPLAGGAYLRFLPPALFRWGWAHLAGREDPAILYLHPWEMDPDQPRQRVGWPTRLNHYHNLARTERRVEALLERHEFDSVAAVLGGLDREGHLPTRRLEEVEGRSRTPFCEKAPLASRGALVEANDR